MVLADEPRAGVIGERLEGARDPQIFRDMLASRPTGEDAVFDQTADLKLSGNQQRQHNNEKCGRETGKAGGTPVSWAVV
jgi:hypothetical protein